MSQYYILKGHKAVPVDNVLQWAREFENISNRKVDRTEKDGITVSTVFLGIDHSFGFGPPLLFETMIFGGKHDSDMDRYTTWGKAKKGHRAMCKIAFGS